MSGQEVIVGLQKIQLKSIGKNLWFGITHGSEQEVVMRERGITDRDEVKRLPFGVNQGLIGGLAY